MGEAQNLTSRLRHRITLQTQQLTEGVGGHFSAEWSDVATLWAEVLPLNSRSLSLEGLFAEQLATRTSHEIYMRWRADVNPQMRVRFEGRNFEIRQVVDVEERRECLRLLVEENSTV